MDRALDRQKRVMEASQPRRPAACKAAGGGRRIRLAITRCAGPVTVSVALNASAPDGGVSLDLDASIGGATTDANSCLSADGIAIPTGRKSGSARIPVASDAVPKDAERSVLLVSGLVGDISE